MTDHTLYLQRLTKDHGPTLGVFFALGQFQCFSLEDQPQEVKVPGDTCIPEGDYPLRWRTSGRWAKRFQAFQPIRFPGSLHICDVPGFTDVLIHWGNTKRDTAGCPLTGEVSDMVNRTVGRSKVACLHLYTIILETGGDWRLRVIDPHLSND